MSLGRILSVAGRLARQLLRDRRAAALIVIAPIIIMFLFAVLLDAEGQPPQTIGISSAGRL